MSVIDMQAVKKWKKVPEQMQRQIVDNAFCTTCFVTTIENYTLHDDPQGLVLKGTCKKCGGKVARVVEVE